MPKISLHYVCSVLFDASKNKTGSVFNVTMFNKMCDLLLARMHDVHLPSEQMVSALHQEWNAKPQNSIRNIIRSVCMRVSQRGSHILLNTVTLKTDPCLVLRRVKMY